MSRAGLSHRDWRILPVGVVVLAIGLVPALWALGESFFTDVYGQRSWVGILQYLQLFSDGAWKAGATVSYGWSVVAALLTLGVGVSLGIQIDRGIRRGIRRRGGVRKIPRIFLLILLIPWAAPGYVAVPLWRIVIHGGGGDSLLSQLLGISVNLLTQPFWALLATWWAALWGGAPMVAFLVVSALSRLPQERLDAARLDGADEGMLFAHIQWPSLSSTLRVLAALSFAKGIKEFSLIHMLTAGGPPMLGGMVKSRILGATSTLGIVMHEIFGETADYGSISAFAVATSLAGLPAILLWSASRHSQKQGLKGSTLMAPVLAHGILGGSAGPFFAGALLLSSRNQRASVTVSFLHLLWVGMGMVHQGWMDGFVPSVLFSLIIIIRSIPKRIHVGQRIPGTQIGPLLMSLFYGFSSVVFVSMLVLASLGHNDVLTPQGILMGGLGFERFGALLQEPLFLQSLWNTIPIAFSAAILVPLLSFPAAAWALDHQRRGGRLLSSVQILALAGGIHTLIPLYLVCAPLGMTDQPFPLILIGVYQTLPIALLTIHAFLQGLPPNLGEQAALDGAGHWCFLFRVLIPLSLPVAFTSAMVAFLSSWNAFMAPLLFLETPGRYTIGVALFSLLGPLGSPQPQWNLFAAASVVNMLLTGLLAALGRSPIAVTDAGEGEE
ncbi:MAG: ABC transporter permease subunit [Spirochaetales bacterium]|nr:ABC transporter permease subunit [Spirochaetales bacterium]